MKNQKLKVEYKLNTPEFPETNTIVFKSHDTTLLAKWVNNVKVEFPQAEFVIV